MRAAVALAALIIAIDAAAGFVPSHRGSLTSATVNAQTPVKAPPQRATPPAPSRSLPEAFNVSRKPVMIIGAVVVVLILIAGAILLRLSPLNPETTLPLIWRLTPSFFFWLGMTYTAFLLLSAVIYQVAVPRTARPVLLGEILPIAVPWFGALGAVTISLEGVFLWNQQWDRKYNYWHIGRPLFGAVLGIVAFFLFVVIVAASGSAPKFLDDRSAPGKDYIIFYVVAFLVGYREETFRELIKRATELILKPSTPSTAEPAVTFKVAGTVVPQIEVPDAALNVKTSVTVEVQNTGAVPLIAPVVRVVPTTPTPAGVFAIANDHVTGGGDLAPGQVRSVDVTFASANAGSFGAILTVSATNLTAAKTIRVTGEAK